MLFIQPHAPQCGLGLAPPQPPVPISGLFFVGHVPGNFGLGFPARMRRPALVEDASIFLADFGEPVRIDGVECGCAIFSEPYFTDGLGGAGLASQSPRVIIPTDKVPERDPADPTDPVLELEDRMGFVDTFGNVKPFRYVVRQVQPDGTGLMSTLLLELQADQTVQ